MKFLSRKLLVFVVGTVLVIMGVIRDTVWLAVALAYIGANYFQGYFQSKLGGSNGNSKTPPSAL